MSRSPLRTCCFNTSPHIRLLYRYNKVAYLAQAASLGAKIAAFPEMSTTLYALDVVRAGSNALMDAAAARVAQACKAHGIWAVMGLPKYFVPTANQTASGLPAECSPAQCWYNTALVIDATGAKVYRQAKMHHAGSADGMEGRWLDTFQGPARRTFCRTTFSDRAALHCTQLPRPGPSFPR